MLKDLEDEIQRKVEESKKKSDIGSSRKTQEDLIRNSKIQEETIVEEESRVTVSENRSTFINDDKLGAAIADMPLYASI